MELFIDPESNLGTIDKNIFGHFSEHLGSCIYGGLYVGADQDIPNVNGMRSDVVAALKNIKVPVLRWPGGCFASEYHWRDGIGTNRKRMINTNWGGDVEDNSFGTHEFFELCKQIGAEPYICGNVGSGTVREMSEWIEYMTFPELSPLSEERAANGQAEPWKLKYFGIGNENWGGGGNMRAEYYADQFRRYATFCKNYGDNRLYKIACGASDFDFNWTEVVVQSAGRLMDGISLHYYTLPGDWSKKGSATEFTDDEYYLTLEKAMRMNFLLEKHSAIMDKYHPQKRIGLIVDEWGTWYDPTPGTNPGHLCQQNTMRDALVASLTLDILSRHCGRVKMSNIAQMVNVLQAVALTSGADMVLTPTYYVYDLYKRHQNAVLLDHYIKKTTANGLPQISASASLSETGEITVTLSNISLTESAAIDLEADGYTISSHRVLSGEKSAHNTFENPDAVSVRTLPVTGNSVALPPISVSEVVLTRTSK